MESFDRYAGDYDRLLDDPLRQKFAGDGDFFIQVRWQVNGIDQVAITALGGWGKLVKPSWNCVELHALIGIASRKRRAHLLRLSCTDGQRGFRSQLGEAHREQKKSQLSNQTEIHSGYDFESNC